jgi:hypothetical protein
VSNKLNLQVFLNVLVYSFEVISKMRIFLFVEVPQLLRFNLNNFVYESRDILQNKVIDVRVPIACIILFLAFVEFHRINSSQIASVNIMPLALPVTSDKPDALSLSMHHPGYIRVHEPMLEVHSFVRVTVRDPFHLQNAPVLCLHLQAFMLVSFFVGQIFESPGIVVAFEV